MAIWLTTRADRLQCRPNDRRRRRYLDGIGVAAMPDHRGKTGKEGNEGAEENGHQQHTRAQADVVQPGQASGRQPDEHPERAARDEHGERGSHRGEQQALQQQRAHQPSATAAHRGPHCQLARAGA
jgi:hypothetical protein